MNLIEGKVAVIFAAGGAIASEVAQAMAMEGAHVFLSGRRLAAVQEIADRILSSGGKAMAHQVDAESENEIIAYIELIANLTGKIDIVFNGIGARPVDLGYGTPSADLPFSLFMKTLQINAGSQFLTSRTAAKIMRRLGSKGTILTLSASLSRLKIPCMAGITAACSAVEGMSRVLAAEFGSSGIKVICINAAGMPTTRTIRETTALIERTTGVIPIEVDKKTSSNALLGYGPCPKDIGNLSVFLATPAGSIFNSHVIDADFGAANVI